MDMENIKKAFECCLRDGVYCDYCPYLRDSYIDCQRKLLDSAIELLKKQEPMLVLSQRECETLPNHYERKGFCPKCHQEVLWKHNRLFCGFCGQAVKWE